MILVPPWQSWALRGSWSPAAVPNTLLWQGPYAAARATLATQPTNNDWDMETAGTAAWTPTNATLSKEGTAHGGAQCMKVVNAGVNPNALQSCMIIGNRYAQVSIWGAGDGGAGKPFFYHDGTKVILGTTSTDWQSLTLGEITADVTGIRLWTSGGIAGAYSRWDDMIVGPNLSLTSFSPAFVASAYAGTALAQATATAQPWVSSDGLGIRYQAGDLFAWNAAAASSKCLHDGNGGTLIVCVRPSVLAAVNYFAATANAAVGNVGVALWYTNANTVGIKVMNGGAVYDLDTAAAATVAINTTYVFTLRIASGAAGVRIRQNGVEKVSAALTAPSAANPTTGLMFGAPVAGSASSVDGTIADHYLANRVLTDEECLRIERHMYAAATGGPMP